MKRYNVISLVVASIATIVLVLATFMNFDVVIDSYSMYLVILWMLSFAGVAVLSFFNKLSKWYIIPMLLASVLGNIFIGSLLTTGTTQNTLSVVIEIGFYVALVFALFKKQKWACIYTIVYLAFSLIPLLTLLHSLTGQDLFFLEYATIALVLLVASEIIYFIAPLTLKKEEKIDNEEEAVIEENKE